MILLTVLLLVILIPVGVVVAKKKKDANTADSGTSKLGEESARPDKNSIPVCMPHSWRITRVLRAGVLTVMPVGIQKHLP